MESGTPSVFVQLTCSIMLMSSLGNLFDLAVKMKKNRAPIPESSKIQFEESDTEQSSSSSSEDEEEIKQELADATFEELLKARANGSHTIYQKTNVEKKSKRPNKNRPMEVSCKKPVPILRDVVQAPKKVARDPRFESLCGRLDSDGFRKRYNFLFEGELPAEKQALLKALKKSKDPNKVNEIEERISWIDKQLKSNADKRPDAEIVTKHKKKEREAAKQGKRPFYLKKSEIRKQRLIGKYEVLKSSGKLEAFIEKRRKRNAAKDHKYMPYRRPSENV